MARQHSKRLVNLSSYWSEILMQIRQVDKLSSCTMLCVRSCHSCRVFVTLHGASALLKVRCGHHAILMSRHFRKCEIYFKKESYERLFKSSKNFVELYIFLSRLQAICFSFSCRNLEPGSKFYTPEY